MSRMSDSILRGLHEALANAQGKTPLPRKTLKIKHKQSKKQ